MDNDFVKEEGFDSKSWTIYKRYNVALKRCDKTFFTSNETGLPKKGGIADFFGVDYINRKNEVVLIHCGIRYNAQIIVKNDSSNRANLKWYKDLKEFFSRFKTNNMVICFRKISNSEFYFDVLSDIDNQYEISEYYFEGSPKYIETIKYERNATNRKNAILIHGLSCEACGFNFEEKYGELGKNFIEVHHLIPLYLEKHNHIVDPETDLVCLCSNCHRMIHRLKNEDTDGTLEVLKKYILNVKR